LKAGSDEFASKKLEIAPEIAERSLGKWWNCFLSPFSLSQKPPSLPQKHGDPHAMRDEHKSDKLCDT
jgi:hypothetical protein